MSNRRINKKKKKLKETIENSKKTIEGTRKNWSRVSWKSNRVTEETINSMNEWMQYKKQEKIGRVTWKSNRGAKVKIE